MKLCLLLDPNPYLTVLSLSQDTLSLTNDGESLDTPISPSSLMQYSLYGYLHCFIYSKLSKHYLKHMEDVYSSHANIT